MFVFRRKTGACQFFSLLKNANNWRSNRVGEREITRNLYKLSTRNASKKIKKLLCEELNYFTSDKTMRKKIIA